MPLGVTQKRKSNPGKGGKKATAKRSAAKKSKSKKA
jgi:hypothetical protein